MLLPCQERPYAAITCLLCFKRVFPSSGESSVRFQMPWFLSLGVRISGSLTLSSSRFLFDGLSGSGPLLNRFPALLACLARCTISPLWNGTFSLSLSTAPSGMYLIWGLEGGAWLVYFSFPPVIWSFETAIA